MTVGPIHAFPKWYNFEDMYQIKDDFSKQMGRHAFKLGADYTFMPVYGGSSAVAAPAPSISSTIHR